MARGRYISDFEADVIRIGHSAGIDQATIARALKRHKSTVGRKIQEMTDRGTIGDLPMCFVCDDIAAMIRRDGARK